MTIDDRKLLVWAHIEPPNRASKWKQARPSLKAAAILLGHNI
jgi:hypothetical protein